MQPHDLKYAIRRLTHRPGFTTVAILSLALGIGANTAMFSLVNAVLLRELPVTNPDQLVEVYTSDSDGYAYATFSYPDFMDLRERTDVFSGVVGTRTALGRIDRGGRPELAFGELVSWDYFDVLGVPMALGRAFLPEEDATPGSHPVVVLGHRAWMQDYGGRSDVLGESVRLNGGLYTIVGVAPEAFTGSMPVLVTGFYAPLMMTDALTGSEQLGLRGSRSMFVKARLAHGVTVEQADEALAAFASALGEQYPDTNEGRTMSALPSGDVSLHPFVDRMLLPVAGLLLAVVGVVLLIACANLASFLLAQAEGRRKEIAVRLALGAGRGVLIRQLLVESLLLAGLGGLVGVGLAHAALDLLMSFQPPLPIPMSFDVSPDATVLWFTAGVSVVAGVAFGLVPALQATKPDVAPTLKSEGAAGGGAGRSRLRSGVVVTQVAFSFLLLIGAGLFARSLQKAQRIDPGFDVGPAALIWPMPELSGYGEGEEVGSYLAELQERLLAHPAIDRVAQADRLPLGAALQLRGYALPGVASDRADGVTEIDVASVSPEYFETMGVPIVAGRAFEDADLGSERVAVVSEAFVERFYPGEDVIGRTLDTRSEEPIRIVGVARDTKVRTLGETARPYVYELHGQRMFYGVQFVVRGRGRTANELLAAAQGVLRDVDPNVVVMEAKTMNEHLALMLFAPRMAALLLAVFGGLALTLAAIGIYGVVSHAVSTRTRELGIRMSLGASAADVVRMAVAGGMKLVGAGGAAGILLAGGLTWAVSGFLYGIGPQDLVTFMVIPVVLTGVALVSAWIPARRASRVDPARALRVD
jgi:predicted permease